MPVVIVSEVAAAARELADAPSPVVVIPVYNAYSDVVQCLDAVVTHTAPEIVVLVVDDGSTDRRMAALLRARSADIAHSVVILEHARNDGYVKTCNDAFVATAGRDVVLLNSDVIVGAEWLIRLTDAATISDRIATATALTNHGTIVSVPHRNHPVSTLPDHMTPAEAARRVAAAARRTRPEIPTGIGHCLYIRRAVLDLVGLFDEAFSPGYGEEVDFCQRAVAHGFRHVVADDVFTFHRGGASFGGRADVMAHRVRHERLVRERYPWYASWVTRAERDESSQLAVALGIASRALLGLTVGVDALCMGPDQMGTQVNTIESIRALAARPEIRRLVVFVPINIGALVHDLRAEMPSVEFMGIDLHAGIPKLVVDILYRPYQVREPIELEFLHRAAVSFVVNQLDTIAFDNPAYFPHADAWDRYRDLTRMTLELAGGIAFLSGFSLRACHDAGLLRAGQPVEVVSCGADDRFPPRSIPVPAPVSIRDGFLLSLGASYQHKNRSFSFAVWTELRQRGWGGQLVVAGPNPPFGNTLADEAEQLLGLPELRRDVIDLGAVSDAQKAWLYERAGLVLYPSTVEGFGFVPFEAALRGVPTLTTRRGALDEVLPSNIPVIDGFNVSRTADLAAMLLAEEPARRQLVNRLVERSRDFTWEATGERLLELFNAALAEPRRRTLAIDGDGRLPFSLVAFGPTDPIRHASRFERIVQAVIARPRLKDALTPYGSRRHRLARDLVERARRGDHSDGYVSRDDLST